MTEPRQRFCVIGPGRLGSALVMNLARAGFAVSAVGVPATTARDDSATPPRLPVTEAVRQADVLWLAVPDDLIEPVAREAAEALAGEDVDRLTAIHSSGLGPVALLEPLRKRGARVLCLHPLQTFASREADPECMLGVPFAVTGGPEERGFGEWLVTQLGGVPFALDDAAKPLYHLAAAIASNLLVALQSEAAELMAEATGRSRQAALELLASLLRTTTENLLAQGPARALTGPVARGDVGTIRDHLALLEGRAERYEAAYRALSLQALALAAPRLDNDAVRTLLRLLPGKARA